MDKHGIEHASIYCLHRSLTVSRSKLWKYWSHTTYRSIYFEPSPACMKRLPAVTENKGELWFETNAGNKKGRTRKYTFTTAVQPLPRPCYQEDRRRIEDNQHPSICGQHCTASYN